MRFVDQCRVKVVAGDGGNGAAAFRREKYIPFGGPSGGDGGKGGDVVFVGDGGLSTLLDFTHVRTIEAKRGEHGHGSDCYGRAGEDREERVPIGTQISDGETGELLVDVTEHGQRVVVAKGGKGGRGNIHFATPFDRAPRRAEKGDPGEIKDLRLTLKVMADVGIIGFPNVGKSTLVAAVSAARPKIADYPFTTLVPMLGVVAVGGGAREGGTHFVIADIPGLIPGASEGVGLGIRFLQHVERTRVLLHIVSLDPGEGREPLADYRAIRRELEKYSPELALRPEVTVLSKADVTEVNEAYPALRERFAAAGIVLHQISAATRQGLAELVDHVYRVSRGEGGQGDSPVASDTIYLSEEEAAEAKASSARASRRPDSKAKARAPQKATSKKAVTKKAPVKKAVTKKAAPVKATSKKSASKKVPSKRAAPAKATSKKAAPKKVASKRAAPVKATSKKAASKKPAAKKLAPRKTALKKAASTKTRVVAGKATPKMGAKKVASKKGASVKKPAPKRKAAPKGSALKRTAANGKTAGSRSQTGKRRS